MRKRFYILFVARDAEGQLRKIPIPLHYAQVFLAGALIGMLSITGMAGSYGRMLMKTMRFNQVRAEQEQLKTRYNRLEKVAQEKEIQVASLGSLASEVTALYGLKSQSLLAPSRHDASMPDEQVKKSLDQFWMLKTSALNGGATIGISMMGHRNYTAADWLKLSEEPNLWPVEGRITGSFGERIDPFNGEGAFHSGVDISSAYGTRVIAPADGVVTFADFYSGYGRMLELEACPGVHYPLRTFVELRRNNWTERPSRAGDRVRRAQRTQHRPPPPLRSLAARQSRESSQLPAHDDGKCHADRRGRIVLRRHSSGVRKIAK